MRDRVVIGLLGVALLGVGTLGCDAEHLQERLQEAIMRQLGRGERQTTREAAKASQGRSGLASPIRDALELIDQSDAEFIVKKDKKKDRTYSGHNFAAMLTTKTIWLGRGIDDLETWIDEIGAGSFINREAYEVRRPDGVTEEFSSWIARQMSSRPRTAEEIAEAEAAAAAEAAEAEAKRTKRRRRRE
ncbi:MAG: hypothetical protein R3A79_30465 [Nannocystaceae bacterium]